MYGYVHTYSTSAVLHNVPCAPRFVDAQPRLASRSCSAGEKKGVRWKKVRPRTSEDPRSRWCTRVTATPEPWYAGTAATLFHNSFIVVPSFYDPTRKRVTKQCWRLFLSDRSWPGIKDDYNLLYESASFIENRSQKVSLVCTCRLKSHASGGITLWWAARTVATSSSGTDIQENTWCYSRPTTT